MAGAPKTLKDAKLQRYYDSLFDMHGSDGWRELMEDIAFIEGEHNKVDTVKDGDELRFRQGQLDFIRWLKTHKDRTESAYAHVLEEETGEAPEATGGEAKVIS